MTNKTLDIEITVVHENREDRKEGKKEGREERREGGSYS
jgi:hypothetical protein